MSRMWARILTAALLVATASCQQLSIKGTQLVNQQGGVVRLKGINWFGFNNKQTMLDGLWAGDGSITIDFAHILYRMQLLGFNVVRLPFSFQDLKLVPKPFARYCKVQSKAEILALTKPGGVTPAKQPSTSPAAITANMCNKNLPGGSTYDRFVWVVGQFAKAGMYVVPDNHVRTDEDMTVHTNPAAWIQAWAKLVTDLVKDPVVKQRLIVDLINEPDNTGFTWEDRKQNGKLKRGLTYLYLAAMDAIYKASPSTLILIEGTGGKDTIVPGSKAVPYWGGFPTDPGLISTAKLSDATPFFKALMSKPYLQNTILSFHAYSTDVIPWDVPADMWVGQGLTARYTKTFGYLSKQGFCLNGKCHQFPFIIGEFSAPKKGNARDAQETSSFADYFNLNGVGNDGKHTKMDSWIFWAWNQNSGDTGGIVLDGWKDIDWLKVQFLEGKYGLKPWYRP